MAVHLFIVSKSLAVYGILLLAIDHEELGMYLLAVKWKQ